MVEYQLGAGVPQPTTAGSLWEAMSGRPLSADLLDWPPDLFALTSLVLQRSGAFRLRCRRRLGVSGRRDHEARGRPRSRPLAVRGVASSMPPGSRLRRCLSASVLQPAISPPRPWLQRSCGAGTIPRVSGSK